MPTVAQNPLSERDLELLSAYLDGELTDREQEIIEQRLAQDVRLRATLDDLRETVDLVGSLPALKAPRNFTLDPAAYRRKIPWWQRLLTFENGLQLAGTLGTVASVALVVLAVLLSQGKSPSTKIKQPSVNEAVAITNAQPTSLATRLASEQQTAVAFNGTGFQSTAAAQNAYYAGTPTASEPELAYTAASETPGVIVFPSSEAPFIDQTAPSGAQPMMAAAPPAASAVGAGGEAPSSAGGGPAPSYTYNAPTQAAAAPAPMGFAAAPGNPPPTGAYESQAAMDSAVSGITSTTSTEGTTMKMATESPATTEPSQTGTALREAPTETASTAPITAPEETSAGLAAQETAAGQSLSFTPTPAEIAQVQVQPEAGKRGSAEKKGGHSRWWLAGIGAITLVVSAGLFIIGRKKAHRP